MKLYIHIIILTIAIISAAFNTRPAPAYTQEIIAVVNDDIISLHDFNKRMRLTIVSSGLPDNKEIRARIAPQVLENLINEKIMLQEALKEGIEVSPTEIEAGFSRIAAQNNMSADKFKKAIKNSNIDITTMHEQIKAQIAWSKIIQKRLRHKVIISNRDVDDILNRIKSKIGSKEYLTAEIFLPVDDPNQEKQVKQLANRLVKEAKSGKASFFKLAQQFSKSAGAINGGDKGWLNETQIPKKILETLKTLKKNQISNPIKTINGYHILFLRDTRTLTEENIPSHEQIYYDLGAKRLEKLQRQYLMDLRATSFIDVRA